MTSSSGGAAAMHVALATLKDVTGVSGSFVFTNDGRLIGREIHAMFDDATLGDAAERLTRLHDTFLAVGDELDIAVIRYHDHKLYLKVLPGGMLCILADGVVNMAALRMAANLVGRRIAADLLREDSLTQGDDPLARPAALQAGAAAGPATPTSAASSPGGGLNAPAVRPPVVAPGTRRFRGHAV